MKHQKGKAMEKQSSDIDAEKMRQEITDILTKGITDTFEGLVLLQCIDTKKLEELIKKHHDRKRAQT